MLQSSSSHHRNTRRADRAAQPRAKSAAAVSQHLHRTHAAAGRCTIVHGRRRVQLGPVPFWIVVGTVVVMAVWSVSTASYFAFREDMFNRLAERHERMQVNYEDRIAKLRSEVDRMTSRRMLDKDQVDRRLDTLLRRQAMLEQRTAALATDFPGAIAHGAGNREAEADPVAKPGPAVEAAAPRPNGEARSRGNPSHPGIVTDSAGLNTALEHVSVSLNQVENKQSNLLNGLQQHFEHEARRMRSVLDKFNVKTKLPPAEGGPFIPVEPHEHGTPFDHQLYRVNIARATVDRYNEALRSVPLRKPLVGDLEVTSSFGVRKDPFLGAPAMHTGLDLRGAYGKPVHATADGKVVTAGWDGGYGNLVEIDHGNGLITRFGHLSQINVKVGQSVQIGQVIGRIGSTGRSTGPHLHYETRINDEPVDPQEFLRAGMSLGRL